MCESYNDGVEHCNVNESSIATFGNEQFPDNCLQKNDQLAGVSVFNPPIYYPEDDGR